MPFSAPRLTRRQLLLPALLLVHAGLLLLASRERLAAAQPPATIFTVAEIAAAPLPSLPVEVTLVSVTATVDAPELTSDNAADPGTPAEPAQSGSGCDLSDSVQTSLRTSPAATAALQRIPRAARSVADAIMLWDGHWIDAATVGGDATLDPVRATIVGVVRAAPADCRDAKVTGPRLLIVTGATGNQVLAFGSGEWAWSQLIES